jgi:hypothetical protein
MGLGLSLVADVPRRGLLRRAPTQDQLFQDLAVAVGEFAGHQPSPLKDWHRSSSSDGVLYVNLLPCEENVEFRFADGRLTCEAKTSTAGPGYHAYLVDVLDSLRDRLGLDWRSEADAEDETGYLGHRAFPRLQAAMAGWLRGLGRHLCKHGEEMNSPLLLGMSLDFRPVTEAFAASQMGVWPREWFERLVAADEAELGRMAERFFPWWERGVTAKTLRGLGLARSWVDLRWVVPADDDERRLNESVLDCFIRAREQDRGLELPDMEVHELAALLAPDAPLRAPRIEGVGFRRRGMSLPIPGGWSIDLPGYYGAQLEDDGETQVYWSTGRTVRASSLSFTAKTPRTPAEVLGAAAAQKGELPLALCSGGLAGKYTYSAAEDGDGFVVTAKVAKKDGLCIVTIQFDDEADRAWAEAAAASIRAGTFGAPG